MMRTLRGNFPTSLSEDDLLVERAMADGNFRLIQALTYRHTRKDIIRSHAEFASVAERVLMARCRGLAGRVGDAADRHGQLGHARAGGDEEGWMLVDQVMGLRLGGGRGALRLRPATPAGASPAE